MTHATALLLANEETPENEFREAAEVAMANGTHLAVLVHSLTPTLPINAYGSMPYGGAAPIGDWSNEVAEAQKALKAKCNDIEGILAKAQCSGDVRPTMCAEPDLQAAVGQSARTADIAVLASNMDVTESLPRQMLHGVLFGSPIGALLNAPAGHTAKHIMVGWDDSPAAARAVHLALPMLKAADEVTIACFDPSPLSDGHPYEPGAAVSSWLGHHGCKVTIAQFASGGREIADCFLARGAELGADLIVIGGYGHSRMRQAIFGGTTRTLVEQKGQPVFVAH